MKNNQDMVIKEAKTPFFQKLKKFKPFSFQSKLLNTRKQILLFQIISLFLVLVSNEDGILLRDLLILTGFVIASSLTNTFIGKVTKGDVYILQVATFLFSIGVAVIYRLDNELGIKQIFWYFLGLVVFYAVYFIMKSFKGWKNLTWLYLIGCFGLFSLTLLFGTRTGGAINWIRIGGFNFQPSEITKLLFVFLLPSFYLNPKFLKNFKYRPYFMMAVVYIFIALFFVQRDLGTAVIFYGLFLLSQFVYGEEKRLMLLNVILAAGGFVLAYFLFNHIRVRVLTWLDPWTYIEGMGYQITQALFAIASGGFFGTGIRMGQPNLIPVVESDFIFAAITEEMGIFTGMGVIMLFLILVYRGFKISLEQTDLFFKFVAMGVTMLFAIQAIIMFGGVLKLLPLTGVTIPFVSYGGSSILSSFLSLGVLQFCSSDTRTKSEVENGEI